MKKLIILLGLLIAFSANAASLTQQQKDALNIDVNTHPELAAAVSIQDIPAIADFYNTIDSPAFIVWRTLASKDEFTQTSGFDFARVDNLSIGKARVWDYLFDNAAKAINCAKANVRAGIEAAWVGTAADLAVRAAVHDVCKRSAKRIEKMFATGIGTSATPAVMSFEGSIVYADIISALYKDDGSRR